MQNKLCAVMGDFNIDPLNNSENFINTIGSFLPPQIFQPTRTTDHSATLIDNIFFNGSIKHFTISGNTVYPLRQSSKLPSYSL